MFRRLWKHFLLKGNEHSNYWLTRFVFLRALGFVYFFAFLSLAFQAVPLIGSDGILPAHSYLESVGSNFPSKPEAFVGLPTVFWVNDSDFLISLLAWIGVLLSLIVLLGFANAPLMFLLWGIYLSFVHIGQLWYGYGWEIQLLETGFLAIFMCPLWDMRPFPKSPPPLPLFFLL